MPEYRLQPEALRGLKAEVRRPAIVVVYSGWSPRGTSAWRRHSDRHPYTGMYDGFQPCKSSWVSTIYARSNQNFPLPIQLCLH